MTAAITNTGGVAIFVLGLAVLAAALPVIALVERHRRILEDHNRDASRPHDHEREAGR